MAKPTQKRPEGNSGRCKKDRSKRTYAKKRKCPNKNKKKAAKASVEEAQIDTVEQVLDVTIDDLEPESVDEQGPSVPSNSTASATKVVDIESETPPSSPDAILGFRLMDMSILAGVINLLSCPGCKGTNCLNLTDLDLKKQGLARTLQLECEFCLYTHSFCTSKQVKPSNNSLGRKFNEVNLRIVYGCWSVGAGYESLRKLCCHLNMPPPMTQDNYDSTSKSIKEAAKVVAEQSMVDAAAELRGDADTADVGVSVDGTWQKKGFTSTNGVITAISVDTGKVLDTCILSKSCKGCTQMKNVQKTNPTRYNKWKADHKCNQNYVGSSPNMEKVGAENFFGRSVDKYNLYYISFYGDGDSKAFPAVEKIYGPEKPMTKYECIGHYQKRVGNRLRKLKKDRKDLGGRGKGKGKGKGKDDRLTNAKIDQLQNYFGIALRQHVGDLDKMVNGCMASMYHVANYHEKCPKSADTWCQYWKDKNERTDLHKNKGNMATDVRKAILPIYQDLCKRSNLEKCLHGKTQNANESFNGMVWNRVPKATHVGLNILSVGVYDAIAHFNYGEKATLDIYRLLNIKPGVYTSQACEKVNKSRKRRSVYRMSDKQKKRRKIIQHLKKKHQDKNIEDEGLSYEAGGF